MIQSIDSETTDIMTLTNKDINQVINMFYVLKKDENHNHGKTPCLKVYW